MSDNKNLVKQGEQIAKTKPKRKRPDLENFGMEKVKPGDNARYLRHALGNFECPAINIEDIEQVEERIVWYFNHCGTNDMKPTVLGLCNALGIDKKTFYDWGQGNHRAITHSPLIKKTYHLLEELWESYMLNGKVNPVSGIFLGKNHFGYQDKQEMVLTPNNLLGDNVSEDDIKQRLLQGSADDI